MIRKVSTDGTLTTVAGQGGIAASKGGLATAGSDSAIGVQADIASPYGIAIDGEGVTYFTCQGNHAVRKIATDGSVSHFSGSGSSGEADGTAANGCYKAGERDGAFVVIAADGEVTEHVFVSGALCGVTLVKAAKPPKSALVLAGKALAVDAVHPLPPAERDMLRRALEIVRAACATDKAGGLHGASGLATQHSWVY